MNKEFPFIIKLSDIVSKTAIYVLTFLLPVFFLPWTLNVLDFNKQTLFIVLVFIAFFFFMMKALISGKINISLSPIHIPVAILFLVWSFSTIFSLWRYGSFWGWPLTTNESLLTIIGFVVFYFLATNIFGKKEIFRLAIVFLSSSLLAIVIGICQLLGKFIIPISFAKFPAFNTIGTVNTLGLFGAILFPILILLIINTKRILKIFLIAAALSDVALLVLINFPPSWWLMIAGLILIVAFGTQRKECFNLKWLPLPIAFLAVAVMFIFFNFRIAGIPQRPVEIFLTQSASMSIAKNALKENLVLGSGPGTFVYDFSKYVTPDFNSGPFWNVRPGESGTKMFNLLPTGGLLNILAILFLSAGVVAYSLKFFLRKIRKIKPIKEEGQPDAGDGESINDGLMIGIMVSFVVLNIGYFLYSSSFVIDFAYFLAIASLVVLTSPTKKELILKPSSFATLSVTFLFTAIFVVGLGIIFLQGQRYFAEVAYFKGARAWQGQDTDAALNYLIRASQFNPKMDLYRRELAQAYLQKISEVSLQKDLDREKMNQMLQAYIAGTINSAKAATDLNPANVNNWSVRAFVYQNLTGLTQEVEDFALQSYDEAIKLEPSNPYFYTQKGIITLKKASLAPADDKEGKDKALAEAKVLFDKAVNLKIDYTPARLQIATVYQMQDRSEDAIKELVDAKRLSPQDASVALMLGFQYYKIKDYKKAQSEFEKVVSLNPAHSNALYLLGLTYDQLGQKEEALEKFRKVSELNPDNEEVKKIIINLSAGKDALDGIARENPPEAAEEVPEDEKLEE